MQHYRIERVIGDGSFGSVVSARHTPTGSLVAIKQLKRPFSSFDDAMREREVRALMSMPQHPHVVQLREVVFEGQHLSLVFEHVQGNLLQWLRALSRPLPLRSIQHIMSQLLSAIAHMHQCGIFHRDIKPENLLLQLDDFTPPTATQTAATSRASSRPSTSSAAYLFPNLKLADMGQARDIRSRPPYTEYVSTRWYRAPEQLQRAAYSSPIDVWAAGCVMAELHTLTPLFAGHNEAETLQRITRAIPPPAPSHEALQTARRSRGASSIGESAALGGGDGREGLRRCVGGASDAAVDLMAAMLQWDPKCRISARDALLHPFFDGMAEQRMQRDAEAANALTGTWIDSAPDDDEVTVHVDVVAHTLNASSRFGSLQSRYFPEQVDIDTAKADGRQHQHPVEEEERKEEVRWPHRGQHNAPSSTTARSSTVTSTNHWPSFSDLSDDGSPEPAPRTLHSTAHSRSASSNSGASSLIRYPPPAQALPEVSTTFAPSSISWRQSSPAVMSAIPANSSLSRPSSVSSTHRSRRAFASVGSQMFPGS